MTRLIYDETTVVSCGEDTGQAILEVNYERYHFVEDQFQRQAGPRGKASVPLSHY